MAGEIGIPGGAAYGATKAALDAFTRSWTAEYSPAGVRVLTVASGPVYTPIQPDSVTDGVGATTVMGPRRPAGGDRPRDRVPRLPRGQLRHRRDHRRRRRPDRHLTAGVGSTLRG
jgi:NAD(P)-dependent dehydrogenase (short-subunit alcohol dehydrogenase family)